MIKKIYQKIRWNFIYKYWPKNRYGGIHNVGCIKAKEMLSDMIDSGNPFALARIGFGEVDFLYEILQKEKNKEPLKDFQHAGLEDVLGYDERLIERYENLMIESCKDIDMYACWYRTFR